MKQIFYGPAGYGKSHLILHNLTKKGKLVIITTNIIKEELDIVGLKNVKFKTIPIFVEEHSREKLSPISINDKSNYEEAACDIIGFELFKLPNEYKLVGLYEILEWLENTGISDDHNYTIVFMDTPGAITIPSFVKRIEEWNADIVIDQMINERPAMNIDHYLHTIRMSGKWFEIPIFIPLGGK